MKRINIPKSFLQNEYFQKQKSMQQIANEIGVNMYTILRRMKEYGLKGESQKRYNGKKCYWYGKKHNSKAKEKMSKAKINPLDDPIHILRLIKSNSIGNYSKWQTFRKKILKRDNYQCRLCGDKNAKDVHHIKPKVIYPELFLDEDNVILLCKSCHMRSDPYIIILI